MAEREHIALFLPDLCGGGAERVMLTLAGSFAARGHKVDLILGRNTGPLVSQIPTEIRMVDLSRGKTTGGIVLAARALFGLGSYLRSHRPRVLLSTLTGANLVSIMASRLARVSTRIILREANTAQNLRGRYPIRLVRFLYRQADAVIAVAPDVRRDLVDNFSIPPERVQVIPNPIEKDKIRQLADAPPEHAWSRDDGPPVILGAGRLVVQKGFDVLIRAFARVRAEVPSRLLVVGEGPLRVELEHLVADLGLVEDVSMPGFFANPYALMRHAAVFVLSSRWEGFPNALIEAMAVGIPVVATDCPGGSAHILNAVDRGRLVPIEDPDRLANEILALLRDFPCTSPSQHVPQEYSAERIAEQYLGVMLMSKAGPSATRKDPLVLS